MPVRPGSCAGRTGRRNTEPFSHGSSEVIARVLIAISSLILVAAAACGTDGSDAGSASGPDPAEDAA